MCEALHEADSRALFVGAGWLCAKFVTLLFNHLVYSVRVYASYKGLHFLQNNL